MSVPMNDSARVGKVLVVDDDPSTRRLFQIMLEADGFACAEAGNTAAALDTLSLGGFDLVLCDLLLGEEDGLGLARQILGMEEGIGVVMITGIDDPALSEAAMELGASGYLVKPARRSELLLSVTNALRRQEVERRVADLTTSLEQVDDLLTASERDGVPPGDVVASLRRLRFSA